MPIYEFLCPSCNILFSFFSSRINTAVEPICPKCQKETLKKQLSAFATVRNENAQESTPAGFDETKLENALSALMGKVEGIDSDDPRQLAKLMKNFSAQAGVGLGPVLDEAIARLEAGDDPEQIEQEFGSAVDGDDAFLPVKNTLGKRQKAPSRDETLYFL